MRFTRVRLENWRNFTTVDVKLAGRAFLVGPNAAGKSNFLDALRFLRDVADPKGGLARAVEHPSRRGVSQLRCLHAQRSGTIGIDVTIGDRHEESKWRYALEFTADAKSKRPVVTKERVWVAGELVRDRPDTDDRADRERLTQTDLEQVKANREFRDLVEFFRGIRYLHIVPQLVREPDRSVGRHDDPFGGDFLERMASVGKRTLDSRLKKIVKALQVAVPQLAELELSRDEFGAQHLRGRYVHWRPNAGWQTEEQFSDGTLRLLGLLWSLLDGDDPLLLEEPELSLHAAIVRLLPQMLQKLRRKNHRQVIISTHSYELLSDEGIGADEVVILSPTPNGTTVRLGADDAQVRDLLEAGVSMGDVVLPNTSPANPNQLLLFEP